MDRHERAAVVEGLLARAFWFDANRLKKHRVPGQAVASMPPAERAKLAHLTAADFQHRLLELNGKKVAW